MTVPGLHLLGEFGDDRRRLRQPPAVQARVEHRAQVRDDRVVDGLGQFHRALLHPPGIGDEHEQQPLRRHRHQLDVPDRRPGQRRVLDQRHLPGELGEQPHGAHHHVVEVVGAGQEGLDRPPLGRRQRLDPGKPVHEQPVSLVGRDAARAGMRLGDVALLLEHGHLVADRRRRDVQVVAVHQRLRAHRLHRGDIVADDGAQDRELPVVQHLPTSLALHHPECQFYGGLGTKGTVATTPACQR